MLNFNNIIIKDFNLNNDEINKIKNICKNYLNIDI